MFSEPRCSRFSPCSHASLYPQYSLCITTYPTNLHIQRTCTIIYTSTHRHPLPRGPSKTHSSYSAAAAHPYSFAMSYVKILLAVPGRPDELLDTIPEPRIRAHSASIDRALAAQRISNATDKTVCLSGAAPAALSYVIHRIAGKKKGRELHIKVHDMSLQRAVAVFEATDVLDVRPAQPHIEGNIIGYISHYVVTPDEMMAVARASVHRRDTSRIFGTLIQQVAWNLVHGRYTEDQATALQNQALEWTDFHHTIDNRMRELQAKRETHDAR